MSGNGQIILFTGAIGPMRSQLSKELQAKGFRISHTNTLAGAKDAIHLHLAEPGMTPTFEPQLRSFSRHVVVSSISARLAADDDPAKRPYGFQMLQAEYAVKAALGDDRQIVILRKPVVYGPDLPGPFLMLAKLVKKGLPLPMGLAKGPRCYLSVSNLSDVIATLAQATDAQWEAGAGIAFEPHDGSAISTRDLIISIAATLNVKPYLVPIPKFFMTALGIVTNRNDQIRALFEPLICVKEPSLFSVFEWAPKQTLQECLGFLKEPD